MADRKLTRADWIEIFLISVLVAFLAWLLYHAANSNNADNTPLELPSESASSTPSPITIPSFGVPTFTLPSQNGCNCGCSCGGTCSVGGTTSPTITAIVNQTNASIAAMQQMAAQTLQMEAAIGNQASNNYNTYTVVS
jgi:hypothetical protein